MKVIYFIVAICLCSLCACNEAEVPDLAESNIVTKCQFDQEKQKFRFEAHLENNISTIKERGFIVGEGDGLSNAKEYSEEVSVTNDGFIGWAFEEAWLETTTQYNVRAYIVTENGKFLGSMMNINVVGESKEE